MGVVSFFYKLSGKPVPYYAKYSLWLIVWKPIRKFLNVAMIPNIPFNTARIFCYRLLGFRIGQNVFIGMKCYMDDIDPSKTIIEDNVTISYGCYFACHGKGQGHTNIIVKKNAYIGMRANIISGRSGLEIGERAIIGACSLVNRSIPAGSKAVGIPAKPLNS